MTNLTVSKTQAVILTANVALLIFIIFSFIGPLGWTMEKLGALPTAWGACIGAFLGLCGVAWTTHKGFDNLIKSQMHRAQIERDAREHQYAINEASATAARKAHAKTVAAAIMAEFVTLLGDIHGQMAIIRAQIVLLQSAGPNVTSSMLNMRPTIWDLPIWDKLAPDIGGLGPSIAGDVFAIYSRTRFKPSAEQASFPNGSMAIGVYEHIHKSYAEWTEDLVFVNARLGAFIFEREDPGSLFWSEACKARREQPDRNVVKFE